MISAQRPAAAPHMHAIYTNLPATTRRAAGIPFLVSRAAPFANHPAHQQFVQPPCASRTSAVSPFSRPQPSRRPVSAPRRNAISFHPSQLASNGGSQNPFAVARPRNMRTVPLSLSGPISQGPPALAPPPQRTSAPSLTSPAPASVPQRRPAILVSSGYISSDEPMRYNPPAGAPVVVHTPPRNHTSKLVASLLLSRAERSRPMRPGVRRGAGNGYVRSGLSVCVQAA